MAAQPGAVPSFANTYEMAGFYTAHMLGLLDVNGRAPTQVALLGAAGQETLELESQLRQADRREMLYELLREHTQPGTTGLAVIGLTTKPRHRSYELLVQAYDIVDGVGADFLVRAQRSRMTERLVVQPPELIDLVGVALAEHSFARIGCIIDFETGMSRLPMIYGALQTAG